MVLKLLSLFHSTTNGLADSDKKEVLRDFLEDDSMDSVLAEELKDLQARSIVVRNLRASFQLVKKSTSNDSLAAKSSCLAMAVRGSITENANPVSARGFGKVFGVHPRNLTKAKLKREEIDCKGGKWVLYKRVRRADAIPNSVIELVQQYWTENSRVSPNAKDVKFRRLERNVREDHATHYLEESQVNSFLHLHHILYC